MAKRAKSARSRRALVSWRGSHLFVKLSGTAMVLAACLGSGAWASGQQPAPPPESPSAPSALTPGELYKQAMHPLDVVRSSMDNWSDTEMSAFLVGVRMAKEACGQASPETYGGDDLYDLARLCSLGQDWNAANTAATRYLDSRAEPHRTQAFALSINALMHLNGADLAVQTAHSMMENQPFDAEAAYALRYLKEALEQAGDPSAAYLAQSEHAEIVKALQNGTALKAAHGEAVMSLGTLYESAMELAFWQRYRHRDADAATTANDIDEALAKGAALSAEDRLRIEAVRTQYALLGKPLPALKTTAVDEPPRLKGKTAAAQLSRSQPPAQIGPDFGAATVLVVFPDWCPQCRKMMKALTEFGAANKTTPIHAYGLMFLDDPAALDQTAEEKRAAHEQSLRDVQGTNTLVVDGKDARALGILDFPLGIVLDHEGKVRFVGVLPADAFSGNGYIGKVLVRMTGGAAASTPQAP
ncbi:peroxiredoxin family protein [Acidobacteria bacterium AB60]|nr:peroxiredoxin family protein [Acidobacteria bacterium AB60]